MYLMRSETRLPYSWMDVTGSFSIFGNKVIAFSILSPSSLFCVGGWGGLIKLQECCALRFFLFSIFLTWLLERDKKL